MGASKPQPPPVGQDTTIYETQDTRGPPAAALALILVLVMGFAWKLDSLTGYESAATAEASVEAAEDDEPDDAPPTKPLPEDLYGVVIGCILYDAYCLEKGHGNRGIRHARMAMVVFLHVFGMFLQVALLLVITYFSSAKAVYNIRDSYSQYERQMYGTNVYLDEFGFYRGKGQEFFKSANFAGLSDELKSNVCRIPFSQPPIVTLLLFLWSLCVLGDVKIVYALTDRLIWRSETCERMSENEAGNGEGDLENETTKTMEDNQQRTSARASTEGEGTTGEEETTGTPQEKVPYVPRKTKAQNTLAISKVPRLLKYVVGYGILMPRLLIDGILLWLGCRWLAATPDFGDLVLNSVGLEFVLNLPEVSYRTIVSDLNKRDAERMTLDISKEKEVPSPKTFFATIMWGLTAFLWTIGYIFHFQGVLPHFKWDVREVCTSWMKENYA